MKFIDNNGNVSTIDEATWSNEYIIDSIKDVLNGGVKFKILSNSVQIFYPDNSSIVISECSDIWFTYITKMVPIYS